MVLVWCYKKLLVTKGIATRSKKLLVTRGITTSSKKQNGSEGEDLGINDLVTRVARGRSPGLHCRVRLARPCSCERLHRQVHVDPDMNQCISSGLAMCLATSMA